MTGRTRAVVSTNVCAGCGILTSTNEWPGDAQTSPAVTRWKGVSMSDQDRSRLVKVAVP